MLKKAGILLALVFVSNLLHAQSVIYKSEIDMDPSSLDPFYSSISFNDDLVFFVANDYTIRALKKDSGVKVWERYTGYKYNHPSHVVDNRLLVGMNDFTLIVNPSTGDVLDTLFATGMFRAPIVKNDVLYGNAITSLGSVFAYDLGKKSFKWERFIGHGYELKPYFEDDRIIVSADGSNSWVHLSYENGRSLYGVDTVRAEEEYFDESCLKMAEFRTHDGRDVDLKTAEKLFKGNYYGAREVFHTGSQTIVLAEDLAGLLVLNNKKKSAALLNLQQLEDEEDTYFDFGKILRVQNNEIWMSSEENILVVDFVRKKIVRKIDLSQWSPSNIALDGENVWLVSKGDGQLYKLRL